MSSQNSLNGEIREQMKKMKDMSLKGKISHLWTYYKLHAAIAIIAIAIVSSIIYNYATHKDTVLYAIFVNASMPHMDGSGLSSEFEQYAGIDTNKYKAYFDFSFRISDTTSMVETASTNEKLAAMMYARTGDVFIADSAVFEYYAQREYLADLEYILPKEALEEYKDYLYYTDASTIISSADEVTLEDIEISGLESNNMINEDDSNVINHRDPSSMKEPVPVGIIIPEGSKILEAGCYDYLSDNGITFQGYPSEPVIGVFAYSQNIDMILKLLEF
ncbi:MAG: hypothetical protein K2K46_03810 [Lachnospiraceae bacterium]|nr:hypothetical protein [Lachnospiraceae bacterium]